MRILVTGATGFLGSHITRMLVTEGYETVVLKRHASSMGRLRGLVSDIRTCDIEDGGLESAFKAPIDAVLHMATCYGRRGEPRSALIDVNVARPLQLLEIAEKAGTRIFINTDTSLPPETSDYARSKRQFLEWARETANRGSLCLLNLRVEHFYGAGDDDSKFITSLIHACFSNRPVDLTPGEQLRDFIHVEDVVSAYRHLLANLARGLPLASEYSVGTGSAIPLREVVGMIHRFTGSKADLRFGALRYRKGEPLRSIADIGPLREAGWFPTIGLEQGLNRTIEEERQRC